MRDRAFERLSPPWLDVSVRGGAKRLELGLQIELTVRQFGIPLELAFTIVELESDKKFVDEQVRGPFAYWRHEHLFEDLAGGLSVMHDNIRFALPFSLASEVFSWPFMEADLKRMFLYRHEILKNDLAAYMKNQDKPRQNVLIFDSQDKLGEPLLNYLSTQGHQAEVYPGSRIIKDQLKTERDLAARLLQAEFTALVCLSPFCSSGQWEIDTRRMLLEALAQSKRPAVYVDVHMPHAGRCYLQTWQQHCHWLGSSSTRCVFALTGEVLTPAFGVLKNRPDWRRQALKKVRAAEPVSDWIAIDDAVGAIEYCLLTDRVEDHVTLWQPPASSKQDERKTVADYGYVFRYEQLQAALKHVLGFI